MPQVRLAHIFVSIDGAGLVGQFVQVTDLYVCRCELGCFEILLRLIVGFETRRSGSSRRHTYSGDDPISDTPGYRRRMDLMDAFDPTLA